MLKHRLHSTENH